MSSTALKMAMGLKDTNDIMCNEDVPVQMWGETKGFEHHNAEQKPLLVGVLLRANIIFFPNCSPKLGKSHVVPSPGWFNEEYHDGERLYQPAHTPETLLC